LQCARLRVPEFPVDQACREYAREYRSSCPIFRSRKLFSSEICCSSCRWAALCASTIRGKDITNITIQAATNAQSAARTVSEIFRTSVQFACDNVSPIEGAPNEQMKYWLSARQALFGRYRDKAEIALHFFGQRLAFFGQRFPFFWKTTQSLLCRLCFGIASERLGRSFRFEP